MYTCIWYFMTSSCFVQCDIVIFFIPLFAQLKYWQRYYFVFLFHHLFSRRRVEMHSGNRRMRVSNLVHKHTTKKIQTNTSIFLSAFYQTADIIDTGIMMYDACNYMYILSTCNTIHRSQFFWHCLIWGQQGVEGILLCCAIHVLDCRADGQSLIVASFLTQGALQDDK